MKKKNNILFGILIIALVVIIGSFVLSNNITTISESNFESDGNVKIIKLSVENGKYVMDPSTIKKGDSVRIEADISKMPGCSKSVVISAFNIRKNLNEKDNVIEFIADKAGTFNIACSMNMYGGTFTVLEDDGNNPTYVEQPSQTQPSCGLGGGCGCGG